MVDDWLADDLMLAIAQENNLAETAFVKTRSDGAWDLRWFAPAHEVNFCGHATLVAAHILLTEVHEEPPFVFHTRAGELLVSKSEHGYRLDLPRLSPEPLATLPPEIVGVFNVPPVRIFRNFENIFADLGSAAAVRRFDPRHPCPLLGRTVGS